MGGGALENVFYVLYIYGYLFTALKANYNQERAGLGTRGAIIVLHSSPESRPAWLFKYDFNRSAHSYTDTR